MVDQFPNDPFCDGIATSSAAMSAERRAFQ
jgi:hypothetical protein